MVSRIIRAACAVTVLATPALGQVTIEQVAPDNTVFVFGVKNVRQSMEHLQRHPLMAWWNEGQDWPEPADEMLGDLDITSTLPSTLDGLPEGLPGLTSEELAELLSQLTPEQLAQLAEALGQLLDAKCLALAAAGLLPASLEDLEFVLHECDENCEKPGGT